MLAGHEPGNTGRDITQFEKASVRPRRMVVPKSMSASYCHSLEGSCAVSAPAAHECSRRHIQANATQRHRQVTSHEFVDLLMC